MWAGSAFHSLGAAIEKDRSPAATSLECGTSKDIELDDRRFSLLVT